MKVALEEWRHWLGQNIKTWSTLKEPRDLIPDEPDGPFSFQDYILLSLVWQEEHETGYPVPPAFSGSRILRSDIYSS